jgi:hypothetical protein
MPSGHAPGADDANDHRLSALLADQEAIDSLVRVICEILGLPDA